MTLFRKAISPQRKKTAFTLLEIVVGIVVFSIILGSSVPVVIGAKRKSDLERMAANVKTLTDANWRLEISGQGNDITRDGNDKTSAYNYYLSMNVLDERGGGINLDGLVFSNGIWGTTNDPDSHFIKPITNPQPVDEDPVNPNKAVFDLLAGVQVGGEDAQELLQDLNGSTVEWVFSDPVTGETRTNKVGSWDSTTGASTSGGGVAPSAGSGGYFYGSGTVPTTVTSTNFDSNGNVIGVTDETVWIGGPTENQLGCSTGRLTLRKLRQDIPKPDNSGSPAQFYGDVYGGGDYRIGSLAYAFATPAEGFRFVQWRGTNGQYEITSTSSLVQIPVTDCSLEFTAVFLKEEPYDDPDPDEPPCAVGGGDDEGIDRANPYQPYPDELPEINPTGIQFSHLSLFPDLLDHSLSDQWFIEDFDPRFLRLFSNAKGKNGERLMVWMVLDGQSMDYTFARVDIYVTNGFGELGRVIYEGIHLGDLHLTSSPLYEGREGFRDSNLSFWENAPAQLDLGEFLLASAPPSTPDWRDYEDFMGWADTIWDEAQRLHLESIGGGDTEKPPLSGNGYPFTATSTLLFGEEVEADRDFRVWTIDRVKDWIWDDWLNKYGAVFYPDPLFDGYAYEHLFIDPSTNPPKREDYATEAEFRDAQDAHKINVIQELEMEGILGPVDSLDGFYARAYWLSQKQTIEQWKNTDEIGGFDRFLAYSSYDSPLGKIPTEEYIGEWYTRITYASKSLSPGGNHAFEPTEAETKKLWAAVNIMLQEASAQEASGHLAVMHMGYGGFPWNIEYTYQNIDWSRIDIDKFRDLDLPRLPGATWNTPPTFADINLTEEQKEVLLTKWSFID
jgi:type II secretory pathway pseudopilin PulG